jgi:DUF2934 family protein
VAKSGTRKTPVAGRRVLVKRAKAKSTDQTGGVATIEKAPPEDLHGDPSDDDIRVRAYFRYLDRGGAPGDSFDDWTEAKKDLESGKK